MLDALAALQPHFDQLSSYGLIVAAGVEQMHLRNKITDMAFTMDVLRAGFHCCGAKAVSDARQQHEAQVTPIAVGFRQASRLRVT